jgi:hypothetical protein
MQGNHRSPDERPALLSRALTSSNPCTPDESASPLPSDNVSIDVTRTGNSYVTDAHWAAVLDDIAEIKSHLEFEGQSEGPQAPDFDRRERTGPLLLYGCLPNISRDEIMACIPSRSVVDQLVSSYFSSFEMSPG